MATTTTKVNSKAVKAESANKSDNANKTHRVLATRDQWGVIFNHTLSLVVTSVQGEALPEDPRKGFAFASKADDEQRLCVKYAQSILAGFVSKKATKVFAQTEGLKSAEERTKIALAILMKTKLGGKDITSAQAILGKAEPKQARTFAEAVLANLNKVQVPEAVAEVSPKGKKSTKKSAKK